MNFILDELYLSPQLFIDNQSVNFRRIGRTEDDKYVMSARQSTWSKIVGKRRLFYQKNSEEKYKFAKNIMFFICDAKGSVFFLLFLVFIKLKKC